MNWFAYDMSIVAIPGASDKAPDSRARKRNSDKCCNRKSEVLGLEMSGYPTLQEFVDKFFQINKSSRTSSWH